MKLWNSEYIKVFIANFSIFFSFMLLMPLLPIYLKETFNADNDLIGVVLSGYVVMALVSRGFSGYLVDSFPRKRVLVMSFLLFVLFFAGYLIPGTLLFFAIIRTLHGLPFGGATVACSTVAIDSLHPSRRAEGIGFYGLSNNIATAISPFVAMQIYHATQNYMLIFALALATSAVGLVASCLVKLPKKECVTNKAPVSLDRFFLLPAWRVAVSLVCLSFSYGVVSTYVAIYGQEKLGIEGGSGFFFALLAIGLAMSRIVGSRSLRNGKVAQNAAVGCCISLIGYLVFAAGQNEFCYFGSALIVGLGNGHMFPAYQTMFINLAEHNQRGTANSSLFVSWDVGVGLGILLGGVVSRHYDYTAAFWCAWIVNMVGVVIFFTLVRNFYEAHKLR